MMIDNDKPVPSWRLPGQWFRDAAFWRQVTSSVIAALITTTIIFLSARAAGFFAEVPWSTIGKTLVAGSAGAGAVLLIANFLLVIPSITQLAKKVRELRRKKRQLTLQREEVASAKQRLTDDNST